MSSLASHVPSPAISPYFHDNQFPEAHPHFTWDGGIYQSLAPNSLLSYPSILSVSASIWVVVVLAFFFSSSVLLSICLYQPLASRQC